MGFTKATVVAAKEFAKDACRHKELDLGCFLLPKRVRSIFCSFWYIEKFKGACCTKMKFARDAVWSRLLRTWAEDYQNYGERWPLLGIWASQRFGGKKLSKGRTSIMIVSWRSKDTNLMKSVCSFGTSRCASCSIEIIRGDISWSEARETHIDLYMLVRVSCKLHQAAICYHGTKSNYKPGRPGAIWGILAFDRMLGKLGRFVFRGVLFPIGITHCGNLYSRCVHR